MHNRTGLLNLSTILISATCKTEDVCNGGKMAAEDAICMKHSYNSKTLNEIALNLNALFPRWADIARHRGRETLRELVLKLPCTILDIRPPCHTRIREIRRKW